MNNAESTFNNEYQLQIKKDYNVIRDSNSNDNKNDNNCGASILAADNMNHNDDDNIKDNDYNDPNSRILWSIDDPTDTLFCANGLINHSGVNGKTVFVTWNENYLINFIFKTSQKAQRTKLTKVRLIMPTYQVDNYDEEEDLEEIRQIVILEYNTLLLMQSGHVYYFSSVKTLQLINWLNNVRCISSSSALSSSCYPNTFSLIRFKSNDMESIKRKQLCLEVYADNTNFAKPTTGNNYPIFNYDITFDENNFFECHWEDERYTVLNLFANKDNTDFLTKLANMGTNFLDANSKPIILKDYQNVQIFTITGNMFILLGAFPDREMDESTNKNQDYNIQLLNSYTSIIECVYFECDKQLLIVLLQSGYIDVWYKSHKCYDALLHKTVQISSYIYYDYCAIDTTFYFITNDQIVQLKISQNNNVHNTSNNNAENLEEGAIIEKEECVIRKHYKCIGGMVACTWVQQLNQLICLSSNNIFYRLTFENARLKNYSCETEYYESIKQLYVLTEKRIKELLQRSNLMRHLLQTPAELHQQIEKEYGKQIVIAMANKSDILCKKFEARVEYNFSLPKVEHFNANTVLKQFDWSMEAGRMEDKKIEGKIPYYILIYLKIEHPIANSITEAFSTTLWYIHLHDNDEVAEKGQSICLTLPGHILLNAKELCLIAATTTNGSNLNLKQPRLKVIAFLQHMSQYLHINFNINVRRDQRTYNGLFSSKMYHISENPTKNKLNNLLQEFNKDMKTVRKSNCFKFIYTVDNSDTFIEILQSLNLYNTDFFLNNDAAESINVYFLGYYLITVYYDVSQRQFTLTSLYPNVLFYMKMHCMYMVQHAKNNIVCTNVSDEPGQELTHSILKMQRDIQHLQDELQTKISESSLSKGVTAHYNSNNSSSLRLENLRRIYNKLRTEFI